MIRAFLNGTTTADGKLYPVQIQVPRNWSTKLNPDSVLGISVMVTVVGWNSVLCDVF